MDGGNLPQDCALQFFVGYVGRCYTSSIHRSCGSSSCSSGTSRSSSSSSSGRVAEAVPVAASWRKKGGRHRHCASMSPL